MMIMDENVYIEEQWYTQEVNSSVEYKGSRIRKCDNIKLTLFLSDVM